MAWENGKSSRKGHITASWIWGVLRFFSSLLKNWGKKSEKKTIRKELHEFLVRNFSAYTTSKVPSIGFYRGTGKKFVSDACVIYEVSFLGKHQIPLLLEKLAWIAETTGEECIYLKTGQYTCLVYHNSTPSD